MSRRCSHCGHNGHNSRTCFDRGFKLFGVRLTESSSSSSSSPSALMRKSVSMGNLSNYGSSSSSEAASSSSASPLEQPDLGDSLDGYASDDLVHTNSSVRERKKGVPWTEEEHRLFLLGLQKLGKGDWRGISRNFVKTRTPTQVASHAQKYFLRRSNLNKRRRRSSLFDLTPETVSSFSEESLLEEPGLERVDVCPGVHELSLGQTISGNREASAFSRHAYPEGGFSVSLTSLPLSCTEMDVSEVTEEANEGEETKEVDGHEMRDVAEDAFLHPSATGLSVMEAVPEGNGESGGESDHSSFPYLPFPMWPGPGLPSFEKQGPWSSESKIVKPIPIIPTPPVRADNSMKESKLTVSSMRPVMEPTPLSYKLLEEGSRHSAFHAMNPDTTSELDNQGSLSNAISVS